MTSLWLFAVILIAFLSGSALGAYLFLMYCKLRRPAFYQSLKAMADENRNERNKEKKYKTRDKNDKFPIKQAHNIEPFSCSVKDAKQRGADILYATPEKD